MYKSKLHYFFTISAMIFVFSIMYILPVNAQLWKALPPYNVLWPLFSPALNYTPPWGTSQTIIGVYLSKVN